MKTLLNITILCLFLAVGCTKKDSTNQVSDSTTNTVEKSSSIVKVTSVRTTADNKRTLYVVVSYLPGDTLNYYLDQLLVYTDSTNVLSRDITVKGINQSESFQTPDFTTVGNYRIYIKRQYSGLPKVDTIIALTGQ